MTSIYGSTDERQSNRLPEGNATVPVRPAEGLTALAARVAAGMADLPRAILAHAARRRQRRLAIRELSALDDRLLKDIGLRRSDLPYVVDRMVDAHPATWTAGRNWSDGPSRPKRDAADGRARRHGGRAGSAVPVGCG